MPRRRREHPWLDRIGDIYYAFWYDPDRRRTERLSLRTGDPGEAQNRFAAFLTEGADVYHGRPRKGSILTADLCDKYAASFQKNKSTKESAIRAHLKFVVQELGNIAADGLATEDVEAYISAREQGRVAGGAKGGVTPGTVRTELSYLRAALNFGARRKLIDKADIVDFDLPPTPPARERWLTYEELDLLRAEAGQGVTRWFIELAYFTAARKGALEGLTWFQVDRENRKIKLNPEGRRQTRKRRPVVPIVDELDAWFDRIPVKGSYVLQGISIWRRFHDTVVRAGLENVTPHTLRHTRAVHLAQQGVSLYVIAGLLGDSISTVEKNYLHHCPDHLRVELEGVKTSAKF